MVAEEFQGLGTQIERQREGEIFSLSLRSEKCVPEGGLVLISVRRSFFSQARRKSY